MDSPLYEGSHRELFELFLKLVDDSEAQADALLDLSTWEDTHSLLSIGGGAGIVESTLLRNAPQAKIWYLDPSPEQCLAFRRHMRQEDLLDRVQEVVETTFQAYTTEQKFDRIVSMFSWFYVGTDQRWLSKLLNLLGLDGTAFLVLPNVDSIEADFNRIFSPDARTTLVSDEVEDALQALECVVSKHAYTKWLSIDELFEGEVASEASLAMAAFVALRPITSFTPAESQEISHLLNSRREA